MLDALFEIVDEHEIYEFSKKYAYQDMAFAEQLKKRFQKYLPSEKKTPTKAEMMKAVDRCFGHEMGRPSFDRYYNDWEPDWLDWDAVGKDLMRIIRQTQMLIESNHAELALEVTLAMLERVGKEYGQEWDYGRDDMDYDDLHIDEMTEIIRVAFASGQIPAKRQLEVCDKLQQLERMEAFEESDFDDIIEDTREALLTDDERICIRRKQFEQAVGDYARESAAVELWDYLMSLSRDDEAIAFYSKHKDIHDLRNRYVDLLIGSGDLKKALEVLDEGIQKVKDLPGVQLNWEELKLEIFEKQGDRLHIINQTEKLFLLSRETMKYYRKLKPLFTPERWPNELRGLLSKKNFGLSATSPLAEIYAAERWYDDLFELLRKSDYGLLSGLLLYVKHFNTEQQRILVARMEPELRRVAEHQMGRDKYKELVGKLKELRKCCPPGAELAQQLVTDFRAKYRNRPAMIEELSKFK